MVFKHGETVGIRFTELVQLKLTNLDQAAHTGAVRALLEMGVFNMLPENGGMTAMKLSKELAVDKELLG